MGDKKVAYLSAPGLSNLNREPEKAKQQDDDEPEEKEDTWRDFCDTTSIHGLRYIGGNNPPPLGYRVIWAMIWVIMFVLCIWLCTSSIQTYLAMDVNTATTFQVVEKIDFPGITLCNMNQFRKSAVGSSRGFMDTLATLVSRTNNKTVLNDIATSNWKHCDNRNNPNITANQTKLTEALDDPETYWANGKNFVQGMKPLVSDSFASVAKFWWNSTEMNVDGNFMNHAIGHTVCFTFNPGKKIVDTVANKSNPGHLLSNYGYGLNTVNYTERKLINAGPHNGLRLLLNTAQRDYCGVTRKWYGAGFQAIVHEPNQQPWFLLSPALSFSPGFDINVVIKPTLFYRKTADLGRCENDIYLYLTPEMHNNYYKTQCYQQCFYETVWSKCKCFPPAAYRNQDMYGEIKIFGSTLNTTQACWNESMICLSQQEEYFLKHNPDSACKLCKEPCFETKFDFEISSLLFPSDHLADLYAEELKTDKSLLHDNYLLVNFHFESMNMRVIDETQAFTLLDLFTYFGGILGLFLGMSVMSIAEVFHQMRISFQVYMRKRKQAQMMNSNLSTILSKQGSYTKQQQAL